MNNFIRKKLACPDCGISVPQLRTAFVFIQQHVRGRARNATVSAAATTSIPRKSLTDWSKPLLDGGLGPGSASQGLIHSLQVVAAGARHRPQTRHSKSSPRKFRTCLLNGESGRGKTGFRGIFGYLKQNLEESTSEGYRDWLMDHMSATECPGCRGKRLRPEASP